MVSVVRQMSAKTTTHPSKPAEQQQGCQEQRGHLGAGARSHLVGALGSGGLGAASADAPGSTLRLELFETTVSLGKGVPVQPQGAGERGTGCELRRGLWWVFEQAPMFPNK